MRRPPWTGGPQLTRRVAHLFDSGMNLYTLHPELSELIPLHLYERGRHLATRLAEHVAPTALLHGDLTPSNILDGGNDPAFDAIDLVLWHAADLDTITARARQLAPAIGVHIDRLLDWCTAFAAMTALELAGSYGSPRDRIQAAATLAAQAPSV